MWTSPTRLAAGPYSTGRRIDWTTYCHPSGVGGVTARTGVVLPDRHCTVGPSSNRPQWAIARELVTVGSVSAAMHDEVAARAGAGLTERARTRRALLEAAKVMFREQGWAAAGVDDIARLAGVSATTAYEHFSSDYVLIGHAYAELMAPVLRQAEGDRVGGRACLLALTGHVHGLATVARDHHRLTAAFACAVQEYIARVGGRPDPSDENDPRVIVPVPQGLAATAHRSSRPHRHRPAQQHL